VNKQEQYKLFIMKIKIFSWVCVVKQEKESIYLNTLLHVEDYLL